MANENVIDIVARFIVDETSRKGLDKAIAGVGASGAGTSAIAPSADFANTYKEVAQYAKDFGMSTEDAARSLAGMSSVGQKTEQQILADVEAFQRMGSEADKTSQAVQKTAQNTTELSKQVRSISLLAVGEAVNRLGMELRRAGQFLNQPITAFTKVAGYADSGSAQYLDAQKQIEAATIRIGAVMTREVAPMMKYAASLATQVASFIEAHPEIAKAAVGLAGLATVAGVMAQVAGNVVLAAAAFGKIATGLNFVKAGLALSGGTSAVTSAAGAGATAVTGSAIGALLTAVLPYVITTAVIGAIAAAVYSFLASTDFGKSRNLAAAPAQALVIGEYGLGTLLDKLFGTNKTPQLINNLSRALGLLGDQAGQTASQVKDASGNIVPQAQVDAFIAYQQAETQAAQQYESQRLEIINDYGKQRATAEANYESQRAEIVNSYKQSLADEAASYAKQTATAARSYYQQAVQDERDYNQQRANALRSFQQQAAKDERSYNQQRAADIQAFKRQEAQAETSYQQQRAQDVRSYYQQEAQSEQDYYKSRTDAAKNFDLETQRNEEDHQREMLQIQQDHAQKVNDLLDNNDAFGLLAESRAYNKNRDTAEQTYAIETRRRNEDYANRLAEMEAQFVQERSRRAADFAQKQADALLQYQQERTQAQQDFAQRQSDAAEEFKQRRADAAAEFAQSELDAAAEFKQRRADAAARYAQERADAAAEYQAKQAQLARQLEDQLKKLDAQHKTEMTQLAQQERDKLNQLSKQYSDERQARFTALATQLRDLNAYMGSETTLRGQYYTIWTQQFRQFMAANGFKLQGSAYPGKASGGYTQGVVNTGENGYEYILTHDTTKMLEKLAGSRLSQNKVTALLSGGGTGGSVIYNDNRRIDGRVTAADRRALRNDQRNWLMEALA